MSIQVENLSISYGDTKVVKSCSFKIEEGEIVVILGASGEGKTSLLKAIAGLVPIESGKVLFRNQKVEDPTNKLVPGHDLIKLVNQDFSLDEFHTVEENIGLRLLAFDLSYKTYRTKVLLQLTGLTKYNDRKASALSGGQRQRLAIARALADEPELVLLDEPFNQLDFQTKYKIGNHIKSYLKKNKISAIMVTHNGVEAMEWADRIMYMKKGEIVRIAKAEDFFEYPTNPQEARFFGELNRLKIDGETIFFRPSFYSLEAGLNYPIKIEAKFLNSVNMGWYSAYHYAAANGRFKLYAMHDISNHSTFYLKKILFYD
jgi:ABC-type Fe3+/spermidine/putrescine transport system ATPase subunit